MSNEPVRRLDLPGGMPTSSWAWNASASATCPRGRGHATRIPEGRERGAAWLPTVIVLALALATTRGPAQAQDPSRAADDLLRLVPADASLVVTVEGLRDQFRTIADSRLLADLLRLPSVRAWFESEKYRHLERSCRQIEAALGVKLAEIRDQVLGDAVVLVLRLPPGGPPDPSQARGLLLLRARDPSLLGRLIASINESQRKGGELKRLDDRRRGGQTYHVREFPDDSGRPPEWYVSYPDGTFAFSNSEDLIRGVVDRKSPEARSEKPAPGLGESPRMIAVRKRLPGHPMARLYVDPRAVERLLAMAPPPAKPLDARVLALLRRHLSAVDYAGAALVWRPDAVVVDAVETLDPSRVDGWLRRWAGDARPSRTELRRVPPTAVAMASVHVDLPALREAIYRIVPEADHPRLHNLESVLSGLMLGQDLASRILPAVGPGAVAYLDAPADPPAARGGLFPLVVVVDLSGGGGASGVVVSDAAENALRTLMALMALDEKRGRGRGAIATTEAAGASVVTLNVPIPFAFAVDRTVHRLVMGTSAASVARYLEGSSDPGAGARFRDLQAAAFPGYETFACVDLETLTRLAGRYRDRLAANLAARQHRPAADVGRDLDHALALAGLLRAAFLASRIEPDASALHRSVGVILRDSPQASGKSNAAGTRGDP